MTSIRFVIGHHVKDINENDFDPTLLPTLCLLTPWTLSRSHAHTVRTCAACVRATDNMMENEFHKREWRYVPQDAFDSVNFSQRLQ